LPKALTVGSHHRCVADAQTCVHHLVSGIGREHAGFAWFRAFLEAHEHRHLGAERAAVELDCLLAAAVEEQIGLDLHGISLGLGFGAVFRDGPDWVSIPALTVRRMKSREIDTAHEIFLRVTLSTAWLGCNSRGSAKAKAKK